MAEGTGRNEILQWLVRALSDQVSQVFDSMAGEAPLIEAETLQAPPASEHLLMWEAGLDLAPGAPAWLGTTKPHCFHLGNRVLLAAGLDGSDEATIEDTFKEVMNQAFAGLARDITGKLGKAVSTAPLKQAQAAGPGRSNWTRLELVFGDNQSAGVIVSFADELIHKFNPQPTATNVPTTHGAASAAVHEAGRQASGGTLDLLLDVELPVTVSFGRAHLPLKEVMKLTTGSIVELNRTISEPVDIIVNNCVIARGEVVVVEGNFGVRIQEVVSRQERLRTLY